MNSMNQSTFTLHSLPKVSTRGKKRAGRGYGSGKGGHTSGRGQKGQKSRRTIPWSFEGGALPLSQRLPFWRGKGRLHALKPKPVVVNIGDLERLKAGVVIDMALLIKEGFLTEKEARVQHVKILGRGKLTKKLTIVGLPVSAPARAKIEKAGGNVEGPQSTLASSRGLQPRIRRARLRGSGVPADFSLEKNLGPSEKTVRMAKAVKTVEKKKTAEHKTIERPVKRVVKAVKKLKKPAKKSAKPKRGTKKILRS